jgi:hypothetical protein
MASMEWHLLQMEGGMTERIIGEKITYTKENLNIIGIYHNTSTMQK